MLAVRALVFAAGVVSLWLANEGAIDPVYASGVPLVAWDSLHYREILVTGYRPAPSAALAFFPLYPLAARLLTPPLTPEAALLAVANACTLAGLAVAYVWARVFVSADVARAGTLLTAVYPPAAFLSAAYTEGPFLLLVALTFFAMARRAWLGAALACGARHRLSPDGGGAGCGGVARRGGGPLAPVVRRQDPAQAGRARPARDQRAHRLRDLHVGPVRRSARVPGDSEVLERAARATAPGAGRGTSAIRSAGDSTRSGTPLAPWPFVERRVTSLSVWNKGWTLLCLLVTGVGFVAPGPIPRLLFGVPLLIFLIAYVPNWGTQVRLGRIPSIARFETAALPCFYLVAWWLRAHPRTAGALAIALLAFQLIYAAAISRGWWAG